MRDSKTVLIAGGAGSIGSSLAEHLVRAGGNDIILIDKDENRLEELRLRLEGHGYDPPIIYVADIRNLSHLLRIFSVHRPDIVLNCCAHKHVVSGQRNVAETTRNNLLTTLNLLKARHKNPDSKFVHISTDKAVEPMSVMGASKMLCECMVREEFPKSTKNNSIVRFGNVMDTQGSVLQIWKRQLESDMAFTVTDPNMRRYMMTMDDACNQILRVVGFESGTYVLDMGREVMVSELLAEFRKSHGCESHPVRMIGSKQGEKVSEALFWPVEHVTHFQAGNHVIHRVHHSPRFDYDRALQSSKTFDDLRTMKSLESLFGGVKA